MCGCSGIDPIDNPLEEFKTQCEQCVGVYGGNKYAMGKESDATAALAKEHTRTATAVGGFFARNHL